MILGLLEGVFYGICVSSVIVTVFVLIVRALGS